MNRQDYVEFCREHGEPTMSSGYHYWPDGWFMENMAGANPQQPRDDRQRVENQLIFYKTLLSRDVRTFDDLKYQVKQRAKAGQLQGVMKEEQIAQLNSIKDRVQDFKARLAEVEEERLKYLPQKMLEKLNPVEPDYETVKEIEEIEI